MHLKSLEISGFKSFPKKTKLEFASPITAIVGPNGSGKSNIAEAFRYVLGEQSIKSMRGKRGEDLIWNGSKNTPRAPEARVKVVFDNSKKILDIDFDEVVIERVVARDTSGDYVLNGSRVRLKDIVELLAGAHIGSSGHHIISQGEADRILSVSPTERKMMIEDALGLKIYQYKKEESQRKLTRTNENIREVNGLRREIKPHLRFLKKQVDKVEKALELREKLEKDYAEYLSREKAYLSERSEVIRKEKSPLEKKYDELERKLKEAKRILEGEAASSDDAKEALKIEESLKEIRAKKDERMRELGRLEGREIVLEESVRRERAGEGERLEIRVKADEVKRLAREIDEHLGRAESSDSVSTIKEIIKKVRDTVREFVSGDLFKEQEGKAEKEEKKLQEAKTRREEVEREAQELDENEKKLNAQYLKLKEKIESERKTGRDAERAVFKVGAEQNELRIKLNALENEEEKLQREEEDYKREITEAGILVGRDILDRIEKEAPESGASDEPRAKQEERRRAIEKVKIRLEDSGAGDAQEFLKEYEDMRERDDFLERELGDLEHSASSLTSLIDDLDKKLSQEFKEGLVQINKEFQGFFSLMFGGGEASLSVVREMKARRSLAAEIGMSEDEEIEEEIASEGEKTPEETTEGVDISVSLPHKRIKGLQMLSGGERALTSIALLFALSQVNPPPFLVLDETDAALDEANSRRYGDMIESLSKHSQLILITHNRETMSRAGVLYGVTMSGDGASQLLSVNFNEAVQVAG